ncbi:MAG TPA: F0F1 ATP synthase subunit epsilon [Halieaceae bacterium]|jgi:F-type H+-transporting ATPase subunit epsilon|uniref:F0F1 ATP synthase subunit epsilon n=1 Tax=Haliea TaxID=475794 RepID=UPI000487FC11|nr:MULTISPECIES: F0F1 ATP synthase subunit epsilon [Haliea]MCR9185438.1 F0F1 ATP synthase subunit epsilon [Halieaceae bacterium]MAA88442.1 F0F1 ATP synthase subunit epsilon [Haliea sp.]MAD65760.1 F0F1 ATP synthase subunit epsilon [Haliea sp.]MAY91916.1 F0F1 ATP synthase subunit epsilon [Haliea sp.]MBK41840.1 F0F1 ATP synthase subunit epsilon [Haliea sp.]|tara:strand:- start:49307 stop:49735 length:429 start_codon:yes stop_codon:yes gene_type:complete
MAMTIHCDIVSAEEEIFSGLVEMLVATAELGEMGVSYGHAPLLSSLIPGPIRIVKQGGDEEVYYVSGGFIEVQPGVVSILADTALRAGDVDEAAAEEARREALHTLTNQSGDFDYGRASAQLAEAAAQLAVLRKMRNRAGRG